MAKFFIDRPIFAWVVAIFIMLAGIVSIRMLPVSQYPQVAPPTITLTAVYAGADAQTLEDSVLSIIEREMNGLDGLRYISSNSSGNGMASIQVLVDLWCALPSCMHSICVGCLSIRKIFGNCNQRKVTA